MNQVSKFFKTRPTMGRHPEYKTQQEQAFSIAQKQKKQKKRQKDISTKKLFTPKQFEQELAQQEIQRQMTMGQTATQMHTLMKLRSDIQRSPQGTTYSLPSERYPGQARVFTKKEAIKFVDEQIQQSQQDMLSLQRTGDIRKYAPPYEEYVAVGSREQGYQIQVQPVSPTEQVKKQFYKQHPIVQGGIEVLASPVQAMGGITTLFPRGVDVLTGGNLPDWVIGRPQTEVIGGIEYTKEQRGWYYNPMATVVYYDPVSGKRFVKKNGELIKYKEPGLLTFSRLTGEYPTLSGAAMSYRPGALFPVSSEELKQREWIAQRLHESPLSAITMGAGEVVTLWGFWKALKPVGTGFKSIGGKVIRIPQIQVVTSRISTGIPQITKQVSPYIYRKLFQPMGRVVVGGRSAALPQYWVSAFGATGRKLGLQPGGIISRFVAESPRRLGLQIVGKTPYYLSGTGRISGLFGGIGRRLTDKIGLTRIAQLSKQALYRRQLIGFPTVTESGKIIMGTRTIYGTIGKDIFGKSMRTVSFGFDPTQQRIIMMVGKKTIERPTGFLGRQFGITRGLTGVEYRQFLFPDITDVSQVSHMWKLAGRGDVLPYFKPMTQWPGVVRQPGISGLLTGKTMPDMTRSFTTGGQMPVTTMTRGEAQLLSWLDFLEPGGQPVSKLAPSMLKNVIYIPRQPLVPRVGDILGGIGSAGIRFGAGFRGGMIQIPQPKTKDVRLPISAQPSIRRTDLGLRPVSGSYRNILSLRDTIVSPRTSVGSLLGLTRMQRMDTGQIQTVKPVQAQEFKPYQPLKAPVLGFPFPSVYGGGEYGYGYGDLWGRYFRKRRFNIPMLFTKKSIGDVLYGR